MYSLAAAIVEILLRFQIHLYITTFFFRTKHKFYLLFAKHGNNGGPTALRRWSVILSTGTVLVTTKRPGPHEEKHRSAVSEALQEQLEFDQIKEKFL